MSITRGSSPIEQALTDAARPFGWEVRGVGVSTTNNEPVFRLVRLPEEPAQTQQPAPKSVHTRAVEVLLSIAEDSSSGMPLEPRIEAARLLLEHG
jgi:hypothetical protein